MSNQQQEELNFEERKIDEEEDYEVRKYDKNKIINSKS
jgi:hypothetical protein